MKTPELYEAFGHATLKNSSNVGTACVERLKQWGMMSTTNARHINVPMFALLLADGSSAQKQFLDLGIISKEDCDTLVAIAMRAHTAFHHIIQQPENKAGSTIINAIEHNIF